MLHSACSFKWSYYYLQLLLFAIILQNLGQNRRTHFRTKNIKIKNNEFRKAHIKNHTCYYFDGIIKIEDFDFDNISLDEKSYENILLYDISCKTLIGTKPLLISFDNVDGFIKVYDGNKHLVLLSPKKYDGLG